jgi:peptidoglycan-N-acetylglucosamine deacetylase
MTATPAGLPLASISLDLDDLWTYLRVHGDPSWVSRPSYLESVVPLALEALDQAGVKLTFFVVGSDAAKPGNARLLRAMVDQGHEIGNHSFEHEPWLHRMTPERLEAEVVHTQDAIAQATGHRPVGFRGPGYSWCPRLLELLQAQGYQYDASTLPTYIGPLARRYYFWTSRLTPEQRAERGELFGGFHDGLRPIKPYAWRLSGGRTLLEIPVTTFPVAKVPFHFSYLHYISRWSERLALAYLQAGLTACRLTRTSPSFLLHPLDLVGSEQVPELAFFPAMDRSSERKLALFGRVLQAYQRNFTLVPMGVHARALLSGAPLVIREPASNSHPTSVLEGNSQCAAS